VFGVKRLSRVWVVLCLASNGRHLSGWYCVWRQTAVTCLGSIVLASNGRHLSGCYWVCVFVSASVLLKLFNSSNE